MTCCEASIFAHKLKRDVYVISVQPRPFGVEPRLRGGDGNVWFFPKDGSLRSTLHFSTMGRPADDAIILTYDGLHFGGAIPKAEVQALKNIVVPPFAFVRRGRRRRPRRS